MDQSDRYTVPFNQYSPHSSDGKSINSDQFDLSEVGYIVCLSIGHRAEVSLSFCKTAGKNGASQLDRCPYFDLGQYVSPASE